MSNTKAASKKPLIVSDLDGTLVNIMDEVLERIWIEFKIAVAPEDCHMYDVAESLFPRLSVVFTTEMDLRRWLLEECWSNGSYYEVARPYWGLHQILQAVLNGSVASFAAMTSRPYTPSVKGATLAWLRQWKYKSCECYFSQTYKAGKKGALEDILRGAKASDMPVWVIEDDPETAETLATSFPDLEVFMVDRPWTQKYWKLTNGAVKCRYIEQELDGLI